MTMHAHDPQSFAVSRATSTEKPSSTLTDTLKPKHLKTHFSSEMLYDV